MENLEEIKQIEQEETLLPQHSSKRKYLLIGIVATIAILVGGGVFLFLNTSQQQTGPSGQKTVFPQAEEIKKEIDTSNWQTYRDEEFGFEVSISFFISSA